MVEPFGHPRGTRASIELVQTLVPYLALTALMMVLGRRGHPWIALAFSVPAAAFLVRVFIVFHDCCHGSFFPSRRANRVVGYATGLLTLTPFEKWQRSHAEHHATAGDLDRRGAGDVWTLTVSEYLDASWRTRLYYRVFRNPFVMLGLGPGLLFVLGNRWPPPGGTARERFSVHFTNAGIAATLVVAYLTIGLPVFLLTTVPVFLLAATAGVWLFYVQHQFEEAYWARRPAWDPMRAALEGSSYYKLPLVLQWVTGNIGLHHVHHVQPRIPFYNLPRCQKAVPEFRAVPPLSMRRSLHSLRLRLVDENRRRMVNWAEVKAHRADYCGGPSTGRAGSSTPAGSR
jgi:omega-6 fatty acid desaturase (delta-12 desaturase)